MIKIATIPAIEGGTVSPSTYVVYKDTRADELNRYVVKYEYWAYNKNGRITRHRKIVGKYELYSECIVYIAQTVICPGRRLMVQ